MDESLVVNGRPPAVKTQDKSAALVAATVAAFLTPFVGSSINIALPAIGREFTADAVALGWVPTAFLLSTAMFLLPFGKLADIVGRKRIFLCGLVVYTLASFLCALTQSVIQLAMARAVQGIGSAMMFGTGMAILTSIFPPGERGRVLGINVAAVYLGLSLGPFAGGVLTEHLGWRSVFYVNVPLGLLAVAVTAWKLTGEWKSEEREPFDVTGSILYAISLVILMSGLSRMSTRSGLVLTACGLGGLVLFAAWELKAPSPLLDIRLFRSNITFAFSTLAALINYSSTAAVGFLLSLYLQYMKSLSPQEAGLVMVSQPIVMAAFSPLAGRLSDRIEPRIVASVGMGVSVAALGVLVFIDAATPMWMIIASLVLLGFGFALFSSPNTNAIMSSVERKLYGIASGTVGTVRVVGQMLSMGVALLLIELFVGSAQVTPGVYPQFMAGTRMAFAIFAVLSAAGVFASLARGNVRMRSDASPFAQ